MARSLKHIVVLLALLGVAACADVPKPASQSAAPAAPPVRLRYPPQMLDQGMEGNVRILCDVDVLGNTTGCIVAMIDGSKPFGDAALEFVHTAKYRPAMRDGVPIAEPAHIFNIRFALADDLPGQRGTLLRMGWPACATLGSHPNDPVAFEDCGRAIDSPTTLPLVKGAAYDVRAQAFVKQMHFDLAVDDYTKAIGSGVFTPETFRQRGLSYLAMKSYSQARVDFDAALQGVPGNFAVLQSRSEADLGLGDFAAARQDLSAAIQLAADDPSLYIRRAGAAGALGDQSQALADLNEALLLNPTEVQALADRCSLLRKMGRTAEGTADCAKVEALDPKHKVIGPTI